MDPVWEVLGIEPNREKKRIEKAFRKKASELKDDPEGLAALHIALEAALHAADNPDHPLHASILEDPDAKDQALMHAMFNNQAPSKRARKFLNLGHALILGVLFIVCLIAYMLMRFRIDAYDWLQRRQGEPVSIPVVRPSELEFQSLPPQIQLHRGIQFNQTRWMEVALENGANPNGLYGEAPVLFLALVSESPVILRVLLNAGAVPETVDGKGRSALHLAVEMRNPLKVEALMQAGADPHARHGQKHSPLELARNSGQTRAVEIMTDKGHH